jgi:hypothetical protein
MNPPHVSELFNIVLTIEVWQFFVEYLFTLRNEVRQFQI